jgi:opacity protein-like surface antigen
VSGRIGTSFFTNTNFSETSEIGTLEFKQGYALSMAGGFKFKYFRVEGELGYQKNDVDKCTSRYCGKRSGDMEAYSLLVNGYYDFINKTRFTPYITAGIGMAKVNSNFDDIAQLNDKGLTYQFGAGVAYAINRILSVDFRYRYFATKGHDLAGTNDGFTANNVLLGLRYNF